MDIPKFSDVAFLVDGSRLVQGTTPFRGKWSEKRPFNIPGPVYTATVDNVGVGEVSAPNTVFCDLDAYPFILRQPTNSFEVRQTIRAAFGDPLDGYGIDGNIHWTLKLIREWWRRRSDIEEMLLTTEQQARVGVPMNARLYVAAQWWREYLRMEMEQDIRVYAFFQEEGKLPTTMDYLPDL